jgi:hypothetical protein
MAAVRAEAVITELEFQEYANARTENISKLMVHSLMRVSILFPFCFVRLSFFFFFFYYYYFFSNLSSIFSL